MDLRVEVDIGLKRPATIPPAILEFMVEMDLGLKRTSTVYLAKVEFIIVVTMLEVGLGLKRPDTIYLATLEQKFMVMGEVYIDPIQFTIPPMNQ